MRANQFDRLAHRSSCGDHVVDDDDPPVQRRTHDDSTFTMILDLFAVVAVRQIVPNFGQAYGRRRRQRNSLVGGTEKAIAADARIDKRACIKSTERSQTLAVAEQSGVEKVWTLAPRLRYEFTK